MFRAVVALVFVGLAFASSIEVEKESLELVASRQLAGTGGAAFCAPAIDCKSCTSKSSCGWCASKRGVKCLASTDAALCTNTHAFAWFKTECAGAACAFRTTCATCNKVKGCGWCKSSNRCLPGSNTSPFNGYTQYCEAGQYSGLDEFCTAA